MTAIVEQVRCPSCGGAQPVEESGAYDCQFCLAPFTFRDARDEERRVLETIKEWVEQRIGRAEAGGAQGIDVQSRSYLFRNSLLPPLLTAYDRALEATLGFERFPLFPALRSAGGTRGDNPLLSRRDEVLRLRDLRAHVASPDLLGFAVTPEDQARVHALDDRLQEIMGLSNAAYGATLQTDTGFAAARNSLEAILGTETLLPAMATRYQALVRLASLLERALGSQSLAGAALAPQAQEIATALRHAADELQKEAGNSVQAALSVVASREEAVHADDLACWLRGYDSLVRRPDVPFQSFVSETAAALGETGGARVADIMDACALALRAVRAEEPVYLHEAGSWVEETTEAGRRGRWLGTLGLSFLGFTETRGPVELHYHPFWIVEGGGQRWLVEACGATALQIHPLDASLLTEPRVVPRPRPVALPSVTADGARAAVAAMLRGRGSFNAELGTPKLALIGGMTTSYSAPRRAARTSAATFDGRVPLTDAVHPRIAAGARLTNRFQ